MTPTLVGSNATVKVALAPGAIELGIVEVTTNWSHQVPPMSGVPRPMAPVPLFTMQIVIGAVGPALMS